ncbi:MAG TPA: class I lanthipeptide [Thermoanaerobaculia bacterium]|nr:class I lanthipeptide [Thermoanaerobaculia bacterium]
MKKAQTPKKLVLNRETVRDLENFDLREVRGGFPTLSRSPSGEDCCITVTN